MDIILILVGGLIGFYFHVLTIQISVKQRTIDNKIKVYDALISHWVKTRNIIYSTSNPDFPDEKWVILDKLYGETQAFIGEAILVSENKQLTEDLNLFNEKFYRSGWHNVSVDEMNNKIEKIKVEAFQLIDRMREDIKEGTIFYWKDLTHMLSGLSFRKS